MLNTIHILYNNSMHTDPKHEAILANIPVYTNCVRHIPLDR